MPSTSEESDYRYCPACSYSLRGLTTTKCPECGTEFTEAELEALHGAPHWLFEYSHRLPSDSPLRVGFWRSYFQTWRHSLKLGFYWKLLPPNLPPNRSRLRQYLLITLAIWATQLLLVDYVHLSILGFIGSPARRPDLADPWRLVRINSWFYLTYGWVILINLLLIMSIYIFTRRLLAVMRVDRLNVSSIDNRALRIVTYSSSWLLLSPMVMFIWPWLNVGRFVSAEGIGVLFNALCPLCFSPLGLVKLSVLLSPLLLVPVSLIVGFPASERRAAYSLRVCTAFVIVLLGVELVSLGLGYLQAVKQIF